MLTITFLVGVKEDDPSNKRKKSNEEEEFVVSDYCWSEYDKSADKHRGVSIIPKADEKFDLYLHGAAARGGDGTRRLRIGVDLKQNLFYTLQVCWSDDSEKNSFYLLDKDGKPFIDKTFFQGNSLLPTVIQPAFYLGGFNASTKDQEKIVKSKLFTGLISNVEIINTVRSTSIPEELLHFIRMYQTIINDDFKQIANTAESEVEPPVLKKKKIM